MPTPSNDFPNQGAIKNLSSKTSGIFAIALATALLTILFPLFGVIIIAAVGALTNNRNIQIFTITLTSTLIALVATSIDRVSDVAGYLDFFNDVKNGSEIFVFGSEILYPAYVKTVSQSINAEQYLYLTSFIFVFWSLYLAYFKFGKLAFILMVLNPAIYQAPLFMTRQAYAILILLTAIAVTGYRNKIWLFCAAIFTHSSAIIYSATSLLRVNKNKTKLAEYVLILLAISLPLGEDFISIFNFMSENLRHRYTYYNQIESLSYIPIYSPLIIFPLITWLIHRIANVNIAPTQGLAFYFTMFASLFSLIYFRENSNLGSRLGAPIIIFFPVFIGFLASRAKTKITSISFYLVSTFYFMQFIRWLAKNELGLNEILFNNGDLLDFWGWFSA